MREISSRRNNYFTKGRKRGRNMWLIYMRYAGEKLYFPKTDVHGQAIAYPTKTSASADLYNFREIHGKRNAYLQKVGPIC